MYMYMYMYMYTYWCTYVYVHGHIYELWQFYDISKVYFFHTCKVPYLHKMKKPPRDFDQVALARGNQTYRYTVYHETLVNKTPGQ